MNGTNTTALADFAAAVTADPKAASAISVMKCLPTLRLLMTLPTLIPILSASFTRPRSPRRTCGRNYRIVAGWRSPLGRRHPPAGRQPQPRPRQLLLPR